jgi:GT2 family glycosyltransferase
MDMAARPLISVCIAHYNGIGLIDDCIASVRAQSCDADIEIIVHDDASTDGSAEYLRSHHPDVTLIASTENVGFCVANNRMAAAARGDYLLLLNNDATLLPCALATLLQEARHFAPRPAILTLPQYDADSGRLLDIGCLLDPFLNPVSNLDSRRGDVGTVHGACLWIDKALWDALGGFPEWFGSVAEDLYLCCRARLAGYLVRALGEAGYRHHVGHSFGGGKIAAGRLSSTFRRRALSERNKTFVMALTYPFPFMQIVQPLHLVLLLLEGVALSLLRLEGRFLWEIYLPVLAALWQRRRELRAERVAVQDSRRLTNAEFFASFVWLPHKLRMLLRHGLPEMK